MFHVGPIGTPVTNQADGQQKANGNPTENRIQDLRLLEKKVGWASPTQTRHNKMVSSHVADGGHSPPYPPSYEPLLKIGDRFAVVDRAHAAPDGRIDIARR